MVESLRIAGFFSTIALATAGYRDPSPLRGNLVHPCVPISRASLGRLDKYFCVGCGAELAKRTNNSAIRFITITLLRMGMLGIRILVTGVLLVYRVYLLGV
ncbi:hypothetical protein F4860DRAFT_488846 [Xylaria cubensis]|nr:hypothetical protein F4860DRAFT_488846 [Xylaria cubensis]